MEIDALFERTCNHSVIVVPIDEAKHEPGSFHCTGYYFESRLDIEVRDRTWHVDGKWPVSIGCFGACMLESLPLKNSRIDITIQVPSLWPPVHTKLKSAGTEPSGILEKSIRMA